MRKTRTLVGHKMEILMVLESVGKLGQFRTLFRRVWRDKDGAVEKQEPNAVATHKTQEEGEKEFNRRIGDFQSHGFTLQQKRGRGMQVEYQTLDAFLQANKIK